MGLASPQPMDYVHRLDITIHVGRVAASKRPPLVLIQSLVPCAVFSSTNDATVIQDQP